MSAHRIQPSCWPSSQYVTQPNKNKPLYSSPIPIDRLTSARCANRHGPCIHGGTAWGTARATDPTPSATPACIPRTPACYAYGPTCSCTIIPIQPLGISCAVCRLSLAGYTVHVHVGSALLWEPLCPRSNSYKLYAINYTLNTDKVVPLYTCH